MQLAGPVARPLVRRDYHAHAHTADAALAKIRAAMDRLEGELRPSGYLVGDAFSVADLTAASLLGPIVVPPEGPTGEESLSGGLRRFREPLEERRGYRWVGEMFARHRKPAPAAAV